MPYQSMMSRKLTPHVVGIYGEGLGSGKTMALVLFSVIADSLDYQVFTNISTLKVPHGDFYKDVLPYLDQILTGEMEAPQRAFYALDDINKMWESRRAMGTMETKLSHFIQDVRKAGSMCMFSAPVAMWTDVRMWDLNDLVLYTSYDEYENKLYMVPYDPWMHTRYNQLEFDARPLFQFYDTLERIAMPSGEQRASAEVGGPVVLKPSICPRCDSTQTRALGEEPWWQCRICRHKFKVDKKRWKEWSKARQDQ